MKQRSLEGQPIVSGEAAPRAESEAGEGLLSLRLEAVADAVARLDERVPRRAAVDLLPQAANADVDRAVAVRRASAPAVSAVRETSVVIAAALAAIFLQERVGPARFAGAMLVAAGIALLALA